MIFEISVFLTPEEEKSGDSVDKIILREIRKNHKDIQKEDYCATLIKRSVDARRKNIRIFHKYQIRTEADKNQKNYFEPSWKKTGGKSPVVYIAGAGPAGLFCALELLEKGIKPVIIEQGTEPSERKIHIADISRKGTVNPNSNFCFGLGGAGTFSDGKLFTRSNKRGNIQKVLEILNFHGAQNNILTASHPHIGTDILPGVINGIKETIIKHGGEFLLNTELEDFSVSEKNGRKFLKEITIKDLKTGGEKTLQTGNLVLATGHSRESIYTLMLEKGGKEALEAKGFACGVRIEHPRELIDRIQFHNNPPKGFSGAEYRLTTQVEGRGVYSFCMCPGGIVVPSASSNGEIVVNGMSPSSRNSPWSNSALVVEIRPQDYRDSGENPLSGLVFRKSMENRAFQETRCQKAPAQRVTDFLAARLSKTLPKSSYTPGLVSSELNTWLPGIISRRLKTALYDFDRKMQGFITEEAILIAPETRTSTPVRIKRDEKTRESLVAGIYPAGEGSGYAGGIVSSALDGINTAIVLAQKIRSITTQ